MTVISEEPDDEPLVRPFTLTRGRTSSSGVDVPIEAVVRQTGTSAVEPPSLGPVEMELWDTAGGGLSTAEISAELRLPLGVVQVLVGDLVTAGLLELGRTAPTGDVALVRRLIDGVNAL